MEPESEKVIKLEKGLSAALQEIEKLKGKVRQLEDELATSRNSEKEAKDELERLTKMDMTVCEEPAKTAVSNPRDWINGSDLGDMSVADMVRSAAEEASIEQALPGYVLQPDTGLYHNPETGYFYDVNSTLFYHPDTQLYYYYDQETGEFKTWEDEDSSGEKSDSEGGSQTGVFSTAKYSRLAKKYQMDINEPPAGLEIGAFESLMDVLEEVEMGFPDYDPYKSPVHKSKRKSVAPKPDPRTKRSYADLMDSAQTSHDELNDTIQPNQLSESAKPLKAKKKPAPEEEDIEVDVESVDEDDQATTTVAPSAPVKTQKATDEVVLSSDEGESLESEMEGRDPETKAMLKRRKEELEMSKFPPCIRMMEQPIAKLHIITITGATVGRNSKECDIAIDDENISRKHVHFTYSEESTDGKKKRKRGHYYVEDLGSRNGTKHNGSLIDQKKKVRISHGDKIEIGNGKSLSIHIHAGSNTCAGCEPGLAKKDASPARPGDVTCVGGVAGSVAMTAAQKEKLRKTELNNMKKQYGINGADAENPKWRKGFNDRAAVRRKTKGSVHPAHAKEAPPATETAASVTKAIGAENKGFGMLSKMGWKEGTSLGKKNDGIREPIAPRMNDGKAGLGTAPKIPKAYDPIAAKKAMMLQTTKKRYEAASVQNPPKHLKAVK